MRQRVLVDTGPMVAIASSRDSHHEICMEELRSIKTPLLTCWPVVTEAAWLLRDQPLGLRRLFKSLEDELFRVADLDAACFPWIADFVRRYQKLGAQLADAALVYLAEREGIDVIFTLDRRDFSVYRFRRDWSFVLVPREQ
jgi:predicted nucleic acid-binding protein